MEDSDSEYETEEAVVLVELNGIIDSNFLHQEQTPTKILGLETDEPILQIGHYIFSGHYEDTLGTVVAYEPTVVQDCDGKEETTYKLVAKTDKKLSMKRIFLEKKEQVCDKEPAAKFNNQATAQANNVPNGLDMLCTSDNKMNHILPNQDDCRALSTPDRRVKVCPVVNGELHSNEETKIEVSFEDDGRKISTESSVSPVPSSSKSSSDQNVTAALSDLINHIEQGSSMAGNSRAISVAEDVRKFNTDADLVHKSFKEKWKREKSKKKTKYETSVMPPLQAACDSDSSTKEATGNPSGADAFASEQSENDCKVNNDSEATHFALDSDVSQSDINDFGNEINNSDTQNQLVQSSTDENITFVSSSSKQKLDDDKCSSSGDTNSVKVNELSNACESSGSEFIGTSQMSQIDSENNASSSTNNLPSLNNSAKSSIYEISQSSKDNLSGQELSASSLKETNECQTSNLDCNVLTDNFSTDSVNVASSSVHGVLEDEAMEVDDENLSSSEITQSGSLVNNPLGNSETSDSFTIHENAAFSNSENKIDGTGHVSTAVPQESGSLSEVTQSHNCETKNSAKGKVKVIKDDVCSQSTDSQATHSDDIEMKSSHVSSCDSNRSNANKTSLLNSSTTSEDSIKLSNETCEVTQSDRNAKKEGSVSVENSFLASTSAEGMSHSSQNDSEDFSGVKDPCASSDDVNLISHSISDEAKKKNSNRNSSCEVSQSFGCDEEFLMAKDESLDDKSGTNECEVFQPCEDIQTVSHAAHISEMKDLCVSSDDINNSPVSREEIGTDTNILDTNCEVSQSVRLDENVPSGMLIASLDIVKNSACEVTQSSLAGRHQAIPSTSTGESTTRAQIIDESVSKSSEHTKEECVSSADSPFKNERKKSTKESKYGEVTQSNHHNALLLQGERVLHGVEAEVSNECEEYDQSSILSGNHNVAITSEIEKDVCESSDDVSISNSNHLDDNKNYTSEVSQSSNPSASAHSGKINISSECDIVSHSIESTEEEVDVISGESAGIRCESSEDVKFETVHVTSCDPDECTSTNRSMDKSKNAQKWRNGAPCLRASDISMSEIENQDLSSSINSHISDSSSVNSSIVVSSSIECGVSNDTYVIYSSSSDASTSSSGKSVKYKSVKLSPFSDQKPQKLNIVSNNKHEGVKTENMMESENESKSNVVQSSNEIELDESKVPNVSGSVDSHHPSAQIQVVSRELQSMADKEVVESSNIVPSTSNATMLNASFGSEISPDVIKTTDQNMNNNRNNESTQVSDNTMKTKGKKRKFVSPAREAEPLKKKILSRAIKGCNQTVEKDAAQSSTFQANASSSSVSRECSRPSLLEVMVSSASDFRNSLIQDGKAFGKKAIHPSSSGEVVQSSLSTATSNEALPATNDVSPTKQNNTASATDSKRVIQVVSIEDKNSDFNSFDLHNNQYHVSQSSEIINTHSSTNCAESLMPESAQQDLVQSSTSISIALSHHSTNQLNTSDQVTSADETATMPSQNSKILENTGLEAMQPLEFIEPKSSICENELIETEVSSSPRELYYAQQNACPLPMDGSGQCAVVEGNFLESAASNKMLNVNEDDVSCNVIVASENYDLMPLTSTSGADSETNDLTIANCDAYLSSSTSNQPFIDTFQCESSQESLEEFQLRAQNPESLSSDIGSSSEAVKVNLDSTSADLQMDCTDADMLPLSSADEVGMSSSELIIETDLSGSTVNEIVVDMYEESCGSFERQSKESTLCEVTESHSDEQELNVVSVSSVVSCSSADYALDKKEYSSYTYQSNDLPSAEVDKSPQDVVSSFEDVIVGGNVLSIEDVSQSEHEEVDSVLCSDSADIVNENAESSLTLPIYSVNESIPDVSSLPDFSSVSECEQQPSFIESSYISSKIHSFTPDNCHLPSVSNIDDSSESSVSQQGHLVTQSSDNTSTVCEAGTTDAEKLYSDSNGTSSSEFSDVQDTEMWTQPESFDYGETEIPEELLGPSTAFIFQASEDPDTSNSRGND